MVSPPGDYVHLLEREGFRWERWEVGRQSFAPWIELMTLIRLGNLYQEEKPDLVHHFTIKPVLYGTLAAQLTNQPGVLNFITGMGYVFLSRDLFAKFLRPFIHVFYKLIFRDERCRVIFENKGDQEYFVAKRLIKANQAYLVPGVGVDVERYHPVPEPEGTPIIIFAARMLWDKGVGVLVEAARGLRSIVPARIVFVGKPDPGNPSSVDEGLLIQWSSEGLIEYWGWQVDMPRIYQQCHIVVLPTYGEGVPTSLLEAAACGRPIVTTDISGCRAIVKDGINGFIVPLNDPQAVANALAKLVLNKELRISMGMAGRQLILDLFSDQIVNQQISAIYYTLRLM